MTKTIKRIGALALLAALAAPLAGCGWWDKKPLEAASPPIPEAPNGPVDLDKTLPPGSQPPR